MAALIDLWTRGFDALPSIDEASVERAWDAARALGARLGMNEEATARAAIVVSELAVNQVRHARLGRIGVRAIEREGVPGIEVVAADAGPGIPDPERALAGRGSAVAASGQSLGEGLGGVRRMAHELDVEVRRGEGTALWARVFGAPVARRREVGIFGVPYPDEIVSGDHAVFERVGDALMVTVIDGLGHGPAAREAADRAAEVFISRIDRGPTRMLEACDAALEGTRGCVMAIARVDEAAHALEHAAVGNIMTRLDRPRGRTRFVSSSFALGLRGARRRSILVERAAAEPGSVLVMFSDGLASRAGLEARVDLQREHPVVIAQHLAEEFGRGTDDVLVLCAR